MLMLNETNITPCYPAKQNKNEERQFSSNLFGLIWTEFII